MTWATSTRSEDLPDDWEAIRLDVLRDAGWICQIGGPTCVVEATEVDHIRRGNDHSRGNLQAACTRCHSRKSSKEGNDRKRELRRLRRRPEPRHPGAI